MSAAPPAKGVADLDLDRYCNDPRPWWKRPHVATDVRGFRDIGVPEDAIRDDGSLDAERLRAEGWQVTEEGMSPPGSPPSFSGAEKEQQLRFLAQLRRAIEQDEIATTTVGLIVSGYRDTV